MSAPWSRGPLRQDELSHTSEAAVTAAEEDALGVDRHPDEGRRRRHERFEQPVRRDGCLEDHGALGEVEPEESEGGRDRRGRERGRARGQVAADAGDANDGTGWSEIARRSPVQARRIEPSRPPELAVLEFSDNRSRSVSKGRSYGILMCAQQPS